MRVHRDLLVLSVALVVADCGGSGDTTAPLPPDNTVASVSITPAAADLAPGATQTFTASAKNAAGTAVTGESFTWATSDASILSLSATTGTSVTGTAVGTGTVTVTATDAGKSGTAAVGITDHTVQSVSVAPGTASLETGATQSFTATAKDGAGTVVTGESFTWETSDASILSLSAATGTSVTGTALKAGTATVTATDAGKSGTASATIVSVAQTVTANANFTFTPATVTIHAGESVKWTQLAGEHDVEFASAAGAPQDISLGSSSGIRTFATPGTYNYVCGPHQSLGMTGQVVVQP